MTLKKNVPLEKRYVRANQSSFINTTVTKEIIKWPRLRNKLLNTKGEINRKVCNKQPNFCVTFLRKAKQTFFGNINTTDVTDNKTFPRTAKLFCEDKVKTSSKITLIEKKEVQKKDKEKAMIEEVISNDCDISETFNKFLKKHIPNFKIIPNEKFDTGIVYETENPVENAINNFKSYPDIKMIISKIKT